MLRTFPLSPLFPPSLTLSLSLSVKSNAIDQREDQIIKFNSTVSRWTRISYSCMPELNCWILEFESIDSRMNFLRTRRTTHDNVGPNLSRRVLRMMFSSRLSFHIWSGTCLFPFPSRKPIWEGDTEKTVCGRESETFTFPGYHLDLFTLRTYRNLWQGRSSLIISLRCWPSACTPNVLRNIKFLKTS